MSTVVKSSSVLEVTLIDAMLNEQTFNLDNPKANLGLASVKSAFESLINLNTSDTSEVFCSRYQQPFRQFKEASQVDTVKRITVLE